MAIQEQGKKQELHVELTVIPFKSKSHPSTCYYGKLWKFKDRQR
jgi:hypothetical protein